MKKIGTIMLGLLVATSMLGACKKKEVVGPTGPAGPAGNANVKSLTFQTEVADWIGNGVDGYTATFNAPIITTSIASTGAVMCYMESSGVTYALPFSYLYGGFTRHMSFEFEPSVLRVNIRDDDGATSNLGGVNIKVVAISSSGLIQHPNLDLEDYEAVKKAFDL